MKWVYILHSVAHPDMHDTGTADDPEVRLAQHNAGKSKYTSACKPWKSVVAIRFEDEKKAFAFERSLKLGSGHAFAKRHFW